MMIPFIGGFVVFSATGSLLVLMVSILGLTTLALIISPPLRKLALGI